MPFFEGASLVNIHGGDFKDISGNHNIYNSAHHSENSGNTTNRRITNSHNNPSVKTGPTRNNYDVRSHSGPAYSGAFVTQRGQDSSRQPPSHGATDQYQQEMVRKKVAAAIQRTIEAKPHYDPYSTRGLSSGSAIEAGEEEYARQYSDAQPQYTTPMRSPLPTSQPQAPPAGAYPWQPPAAQPPFLHIQSEPLYALPPPQSRASPTPPHLTKSKDPFARRVADPQEGQTPVPPQSTPPRPIATVSDDMDMEEEER